MERPKPTTIPEMKAQQERYTRAADRATKLSESNKERFDQSVVLDIHLGQRNAGYKRFVDKYNTLTVNLDQEIERRQTILIPLAEQFLANIKSYHELFNQPQEVLDVLPAALLEKRRAEFEKLNSEPNGNPELKQGLELLKAQRLQELAQSDLEKTEKDQKVQEINNSFPWLQTEQPAQEATSIANEEPKQDEGSKKGMDHRERRQEFVITLPDGNQITVTGPTQVKIITALVTALTSDNPELTTAQIAELINEKVGSITGILSNLQDSKRAATKILEAKGWQVQSRTTADKQGRKNFYTLRKLPKEETTPSAVQEPQPTELEEIQSKPDKTQAEVTKQDVIIAPVAYKFNPEQSVLEIVGGKKKTLTGREHVIVQQLYTHLGEEITSRDLQLSLQEVGLSPMVGSVIYDLEKELGAKLFTRIGHRRTGAKWALGYTHPLEILITEQPTIVDSYNTEMEDITLKGERQQLIVDTLTLAARNGIKLRSSDIAKIIGIDIHHITAGINKLRSSNALKTQGWVFDTNKEQQHDLVKIQIEESSLQDIQVGQEETPPAEKNVSLASFINDRIEKYKGYETQIKNANHLNDDSQTAQLAATETEIRRMNQLLEVLPKLPVLDAETTAVMKKLIDSTTEEEFAKTAYSKYLENGEMTLEKALERVPGDISAINRQLEPAGIKIDETSNYLGIVFLTDAVAK